MPLNLNQIGQIALPVRDVDRSETFYEKIIGLRKLYRFGDLTFFDCAGVRLLLDKAEDAASLKPQGCIYFRCADIAFAAGELTKRGVKFASNPQLIAKMADHDLWMAFFADPDGHTLALMQEAPRDTFRRLRPTSEVGNVADAHAVLRDRGALWRGSPCSNQATGSKP